MPIKVSVFLRDISEFEKMNAVYADFFGNKNLPVRSAVAAGGLALDARVEIGCTALIGG